MARGMQKIAQNNLKKMVSGAGQKATKHRQKTSKAILSRSNYDQLVEQMNKNGKTIQKVPISMIDLGQNIREQYDSDKLKILADSISHDGLIQHPTLCLTRSDSKRLGFICRNGHRRILAVKSLGWETVEAMIVPFKSEQDAIYHSINANLKEDVFYLDLSYAYQDAADMGESDQDIGKRVGVNPRTVGWYRRLTKMSLTCQALCRKHPEIFNATWAVKLARQGELPNGKILETKMREILRRSLRSGGAARGGSLEINMQKRRSARIKLKRMMSDRRHAPHRSFSLQLLNELVSAGYISARAWQKIENEFFKIERGAGGSSKRGVS